VTTSASRPTSKDIAYDRTLRDLLGVVILWMLTIVTAISFCRIFSGWGFLTSYIMVATTGHLVAYALRRWRLPFLLSFVGVTLFTYLLASYFQARQTLTFGLPLGRTWSFVWQEISDSWKLLGDAVPPLTLQSGFGFVGLVSIGLIAFLSDAFAFRFAGRVESLIPSTIIFVVLSSVGVDRNRTIVTALWIATAIISVAVLRLRHQLARSSKIFGYRPGRTTMLSASHIALLAVVASLIALMIGPRIPGATEDSWLANHSGQAGPQLDPLVDIRGRLNDPTDEILFSVASESPSYWRTTSLPNFDGNKWTISQDLLDSAGGELANASTISEVGVAQTNVTQLVTIQSLAGSFAPVADRPVQLRSATRSLFYEPQSGTLLVSKDGLKRNDNYQIVSTVVVPSADTLRISSSSSPPDVEYLQLPQNQEIAELQQVVDQIIKGSTGNYEKLLAIQSYFRDNFTYSLDVPTSNSSTATLEFLNRKTGYCEQFSSTFALFARLIGIPSRVAIGFTPGEQSPIGTSNVQLFNVRSQYAHAWPEVWFDGIGWVLFEPTPGRGAPSADYTNVAPAQDDSTPTAVAPTTSALNQPSTTTANGSTTVPVNSSTPATPSTTDSSRSSAQVFIYLALGIALIALWAFAMPRFVRSTARRRESNVILLTWRSAVAQFEAVHGELPSQLTVFEIGERFIEQSWTDAEVIERIVNLVTQHLFATLESRNASYQELDDFVTTHHAQLPWKIQIRECLSPRLAWKLAGGKQTRP
jgi:transglutaminase-like putative cysteine protease